MRMTTNAAVAATVAAIAAAIIGVAVAAGLDMSKDLQDRILTLITVATPAVLGLVAWMHHNSAKVTVAKVTTGTVR